jgi:hypothetical protein
MTCAATPADAGIFSRNKRDPIVHDDAGPTGGIDGCVCARVLLPPDAEDSQLGGDFFTQILVRRELEVAPLQHGPALVDGPIASSDCPGARSFRTRTTSRSRRERPRSFEPSAPHHAERQNERMLGAIRTQTTDEQRRSFCEVFEAHDRPPSREATRQTTTLRNGEHRHSSWRGDCIVRVHRAWHGTSDHRLPRPSERPIGLAICEYLETRSGPVRVPTLSRP